MTAWRVSTFFILFLGVQTPVCVLQRNAHGVSFYSFLPQDYVDRWKNQVTFGTRSKSISENPTHSPLASDTPYSLYSHGKATAFVTDIFKCNRHVCSSRIGDLKSPGVVRSCICHISDHSSKILSPCFCSQDALSGVVLSEVIISSRKITFVKNNR